MIPLTPLHVSVMCAGAAGVAVLGGAALLSWSDTRRRIRDLARTKQELEASVGRWEARAAKARQYFDDAAKAALAAARAPEAAAEEPIAEEPSATVAEPVPKAAEIAETPVFPGYPEPLRVAAGDPADMALLPGAAALPPVSAEGLRWAWEDAAFRRGSVAVVPGAREKTPVYAIGDLHGDARSLREILAWILGRGGDFRAVFLGDLVDRASGADTLECVRLFLWAARTNPGRFLWLRGNHDFLSWDEAAGRFHSPVSPHDFEDFLNGHPEFRGEGKALCAVMATLPVAVVVGNAWLSHGGVLQDDALGLGSFTGLASLTGKMREDFVWSRMKDAPSKLAGRAHLGSEVGFGQAAAFARRLRDTDGLEIAHFVCAHQHEDRDGFGYLAYERNFTGPTCQCICSFDNGDGFDGPARPVILRLDGHGTPVPVFFERAR